MALELLFGRASSDHELALLERVQATLAADDQAEIFYVVPNHIKFETEIQVLNRLATLQDRHGAAVAVPNVQVFSLSRLAWFRYSNRIPQMQDSAIKAYICKTLSFFRIFNFEDISAKFRLLSVC